MLVAMLGMTMRASASSGRTANVISASAIGGRPMPIAPLAIPATMKAPAITSICVTVIAELYSSGVGEDLLHEARVGFTDQARDRPAENGERLRIGRRRRNRAGRDIEREAGIVLHLLEAVAGMNRLQPESATLLVEGEPAEIGQESDRTARTIDAVGPRPGRGDEVDLGHHHAARVFFAEQDHPRHQIVEIGRAERARPAERGLRIGPARADQVDIGLAVDLAATQEEGI